MTQPDDTRERTDWIGVMPESSSSITLAVFADNLTRNDKPQPVFRDEYYPPPRIATGATPVGKLGRFKEKGCA